ncbi:MAG: arylsulfatase [Phycisphaeraceae bacterium]|nr:arylsulfatase [Phycisphaeraceae bacterium]
MNQRPNIVLIFADDLGYGDLSCLNPEGRIPTPHHDRLAREGVTLADCHANSSVCTPSRYGLMTGRYAWRTWLKRGVLTGYSPPLIDAGRTTLASLLRQAGYRTSCIGKWHLGLGWTTLDGSALFRERGDEPALDFTQPLDSGPHTLGFDESLILPASLDMAPYYFVENGMVVDQPGRTVGASPRPNFHRAGPAGDGFEHETCLLELTRRAEAFIDHAARDHEPFFLYFPTTSPHTPHVPRAPFRGKSRAGVYGDFVVEHDWSVGQILQSLDRHGIADNTLVIATSDNGAHMRDPKSNFDLFRDFGHRSNHIYRGQKSDAWDGGHRVPCLMRWPGTIAAGSTCDQLTSLTDLLATFAELTDQSMPEEAGEDSVSMLSLLTGQNFQPARNSVIHHSITGQFAIRDSRWKLIECRGSGGWSLPEQDVPADDPAGQLYDMLEDPGEQRNLYAERPDIVERLGSQLNAQRGDAHLG